MILMGGWGPSATVIIGQSRIPNGSSAKKVKARRRNLVLLLTHGVGPVEE